MYLKKEDYKKYLANKEKLNSLARAAIKEQIWEEGNGQQNEVEKSGQE